MTFITSSAPSATLASSGASSRLAGLASAIGEYFRVRRSINELRSLSPEALKDIGIERSEIERIVRFGR